MLWLCWKWLSEKLRKWTPAFAGVTKVMVVCLLTLVFTSGVDGYPEAAP